MNKDLILVSKTVVRKLQKKSHLLGIIDGIKLVSPFIPSSVSRRLINAAQKDIIALNEAEKKREEKRILVVVQ